MTICILFAAWGRAGFSEMLDFVKEKNFSSSLCWAFLCVGSGCLSVRFFLHRTAIRKQNVYRRHKVKNLSNIAFTFS